MVRFIQIHQMVFLFFVKKRQKNLYYNLNKWGDFKVSLLCLKMTKKGYYSTVIYNRDYSSLLLQYFVTRFTTFVNDLGKKCLEQKRMLDYCCIVDDIWQYAWYWNVCFWAGSTQNCPRGKKVCCGNLVHASFHIIF